MIKALDFKVDGLTSAQLHKVISGIQRALAYPDSLSFIANDPRITYEILPDKVYSDKPIYKDDKSDNLYVLITTTGTVLALMSRGRLTHTGDTNKTIYRAIVENSGYNMQWLLIKNPVYKKDLSKERHEARKDSEVYEREKDKASNNSLITKHLRTLERVLKDSDYENDNFLLIARRAALESKNGNEDFFERVYEEYGQVAYEASQAIKYLKNIYVERFGEQYSPKTVEDHKRNTGNYKGYPWSPNYGLYRDSTSVRDKSGYRINIEKYLWKRVDAFVKAKDRAVIEKLEDRYNDLIQNALPEAVSRYIVTERWDKLKLTIDKIKDLKERLDQINKWATDNTNHIDFRWRDIAKYLPTIIQLLQKIKDELHDV